MTTTQIAPAARQRLLPPETGRASFADALRSEFTKIRSTRSTYWTLFSHHLSATLGEPNVLRAVIGGALFLTACGMLAYGLGAILRHTAAAISAAIGCCSC